MKYFIKKKSNTVIVILTIFIGLLVLSFLHGYITSTHKKLIKAHKKDHAEAITTRFQAALENRFSIVDAVGAIMEVFPQTNAESFYHIAREFVENNKPVRAIQFADTSTFVTYNYPYKTNEISTKKPIRLIDDPKRGPWVKQTIRTGRKSIQTPFELRQGGLGTVVRKALFVDRSFAGLSIGVFNMSDIISESIIKENNNTTFIRLSDSTGSIFYTDSLFDDKSSIRTVLDLQDTKWFIDIYEEDKAIDSIFDDLILLWAMGIPFILALIFLEFFFLSSNERLKVIVAKRSRELIESNSKLLETENLRTTGQLAGGIAHNLNNHLATIQGFAELIQDNNLSTEKNTHYVSNILKQCKHSSVLISKLLSFARMNIAIVKELDLNSLIEKNVNQINNDTKIDMKFSVQLNNKDTLIKGDKKLISSIISYIITNSIEATKGNGTLTISSENIYLTNLDPLYKTFNLRDNYFIKVSFTDNGPGIDSTILKNVFEPFFSTKDTSEGKGLGLPAAYGIVVNHYGAIEIKSQVKQGTTVDIFLPVYLKN